MYFPPGVSSSPQEKVFPLNPPRAAYSHSASVGNRFPAQAANAVASFHDICKTGSSSLAPRPGPHGCFQFATSTRPHPFFCTSNTPDHPNFSASVTYFVASTKTRNCATVTSVLSIQNEFNFTRCTGPSYGAPSLDPISNSPA